jgi:hypothetical protein
MVRPWLALVEVEHASQDGFEEHQGVLQTYDAFADLPPGVQTAGTGTGARVELHH